MKIGLALGGGGAKGFAHLPYLKEIDDLGIKISYLSGTSMGAVIGAFYAGGMSAAEIIKLTTQLGFLETFKLTAPTTIQKSGLVDGKNIEKFLAETLPVLHFEDLKIPLKISSTDYWKGEEYIFDHGDLIPAIRASISLPGFFQPYLFDDRLFVDGGLVNPVPFDLLTDADFIIAIDVLNETHKDKKIPGSLDILIGSYYIMMQNVLRYKDYQSKTDLYCTPDVRRFNTLAFHKSKEIISSVKKDIEEFKEKISAALDLKKP